MDDVDLGRCCNLLALNLDAIVGEDAKSMSGKLWEMFHGGILTNVEGMEDRLGVNKIGWHMNLESFNKRIQGRSMRHQSSPGVFGVNSSCEKRNARCFDNVPWLAAPHKITQES